MLKIYRWSSIAILFIAISAISASQQHLPKNRQETATTQQKNVLWADPGDVAALDFRYGIGGPDRQPQPPFHFVREDKSGTTPKVDVTDARNVKWNVKWGSEARATTFCGRMAWAAGYIAQPEYFVASGRIEGVHGLDRARDRVSKDGSFEDARFQLRTDSPRFLGTSTWTWTENPFVGTRELQGLKILLMLVSTWDTKNANLATFEDNSPGGRRLLYADIDWGSCLGKWGGLLTWRKYDCKGFVDQTPDFVKGVTNGEIEWGFKGKHRGDVADNITVEDVQWLLQYVGRITDKQIRVGLEASGVSPADTESYAHALRDRIEQLERVAGSVSVKNTSKF